MHSLKKMGRSVLHKAAALTGYLFVGVTLLGHLRSSAYNPLHDELEMMHSRLVNVLRQPSKEMLRRLNDAWNESLIRDYEFEISRSSTAAHNPDKNIRVRALRDIDYCERCLIYVANHSEYSNTKMEAQRLLDELYQRRRDLYKRTFGK